MDILSNNPAGEVIATMGHLMNIVARVREPRQEPVCSHEGCDLHLHYHRHCADCGVVIKPRYEVCQACKYKRRDALKAKLAPENQW